GSLDEVAITSIRDRLAQLEELDKRRESILKSLEERQLLTDELREKIAAAETMSVLEDIYLPFRPKRRTRATVAREKGLEPLSLLIFEQRDDVSPEVEAASFIDPEKGVETIEEALSGARDIIAEVINENQEARARMRAFFEEKAVFRSKVVPEKEAEGAKFRDYFDWTEAIAAAPSHRILAMRRGEHEEALTLRITPPEEEALSLLNGIFIKGENASTEQVKLAIQDSYKRLLSSSMETEMRIVTKDRADREAIRVFADNLRNLLLAPPLGQKSVLAIDPGIRTGCKVCCLDRQGKLLHTDTIFLYDSGKNAQKAAGILQELCERDQVEAIAIGNGTASRETEAFVKSLSLAGSPPVIMVNESGASVYSASEVARKEFPDLDVSYRGAVSIGRRLMDPLAELVKIDPKSIGVGQYQHDVNQQALKQGLDDVVISCVNAVGVEVNTASEQLLTYVSGLGPMLAKNIVLHRNEHGPFLSRERLRDVPRLGPKAFEQCAGFLRIRNGENALDASAVHPESYHIVEEMAEDVQCTVKDLLGQEALREKIDLSRYVTDAVGLPTLTDILSELAKPGRDPRAQFETLTFADGIEKMEDLRPGMRLPGIVTNVTAFGAFVDIGVHQDGLVHISQLSDRFVKGAHAAVKVHQHVQVTVLEVDLERKRISLSMRDNPDKPSAASPSAAPAARKGPEKNKKTEGRRRPAIEQYDPNNPFVKALKGKIFGKN
ncbi:MAG TPA: Tex family protein, partial [Thermodesulfobacteriota bacterium]|nr:Tex family protein [Thermodesulfobacteriota bacterium]